MHGYPKNLNTKEDYLYVKENFPKEKWEKDWQDLLDSRQNWFFVEKLESAKKGKNDATHKVVEEKGMSEEDEPTYSQYELKEDPNAKIFRLGFTVKEVEDALA